MLYAVDLDQGSPTVRAGGSPDVDLVAFDRFAGAKIPSGDPGQGLVRRHLGFDVEQAEAVAAAGCAFNALGVVDGFAQHLIAAADSQNLTAASDMGHQINVPALPTQEGKIAAGRFRAGQDDQIGVAGQRFARMDHADRDAGGLFQWVQVIKVGDPRQHWADDQNVVTDRVSADVGCVLGWQSVGVLKPGDHAQALPAGGHLNG